MKTCKKCDTANDDLNDFCVNCAEKLSVESEEVQVKSRKKWPFILVGILLLIVIIGSSAFSLLKPTPVEKALLSLQQAYAKEKQEGHLELSIRSDYDDFGVEVLEDMALLVDFERQNLDLHTKIDLTLDEHSLMSSVLALEDGVIFIDFLDYYDDIFYFENNLLEDLFQQSGDLQKYINNFSMKGVDVRKYAAILEKELSRDIKVDGNKIEIEINEDNLFDILEAIIEEISDDDVFKEVLHREIVKTLTSMIEDDYEYMFYDDSDWEDALEEIEDYDDFEDNFEDGLDEMLKELDDAQYYNDEEFEFEITLETGLFYKLKNGEFSFEIDGVKSKLIYNNKNEYTFKDYDITASEDFEDILYDLDELQEVVEDISSNIADFIDDNDDLEDYIEDTDLFIDYTYYSNTKSIETFIEAVLEELIEEIY